MGLKSVVTTIALIVAMLASVAEAGWQGPTEVITGTWGANNEQFGISYGDTNDVFGGPFYILIDGRLIVTDLMNGRRKIYSGDGTLMKVIKCVKSPIGEWNEECRIPLDDYIQTTTDGNIWLGLIQYRKQQYSLYSPAGQLIKTSTTRPLELGVIKEQKLGESNYKITVSYPDREYSFSLKGPYEKYIRDSKKYIYALSGKAVKKFNTCGKELGSLSTPEDQSKLVRPGGRGLDALYDLIAEYGEPIVAPNGDVYTWKRTPDKYSILKWTWVDDPNVPTGPDAPSGLAVTPSINGLYLTWKASPNDPGCVTKYEIARSTTSGGVFSTIDTVEKGVLKYNDTTAEAGTTYYYKVRAMAGSDPSAYTAEVSGKR